MVEFKLVDRQCNVLAFGLARDRASRASFFKVWCFGWETVLVFHAPPFVLCTANLRALLFVARFGPDRQPYNSGYHPSAPSPRAPIVFLVRLRGCALLWEVFVVVRADLQLRNVSPSWELPTSPNSCYRCRRGVLGNPSSHCRWEW
ncbi:hypothetical protein V6N11_055319 [Hibiscus sabdariffa]|uniref:Uncharacterized protein n=2 Tax=Hibiscus sabdariffa TaxID=183260 RepID=A0ABR2A0S0_9ROSI